MRRLFGILVMLVWGLWFGGLVALFIAVTALFHALDRHTAGVGAARIFRVFNLYQLALATAALLAAFFWRVVGPPRFKEALFTFFAIATAGACAIAIWIAPKIAELQAQGLTESGQFGKVHGLSMAVYLAEVVALFLAGILIPFARET
jgi:hypothetical protein